MTPVQEQLPTAKRRPFSVKMIVLTVLALLFAAAFSFGIKSMFEPQRPTHRLVIPEKYLNIGEVWESDHFSWTVPVENQSSEPIEVTHFSKSCTCLSIEPEAFVLGPGEKRDLKLKIDMATNGKDDIAVYLAPRLKGSDDKNAVKLNSIDWTIRGHVRRALKYNRKVYVGRYSEFAQPLRSFTVPIDVVTPLDSFSARCDTAGFVVSVEMSTENKSILRITPPSTLPLGSFNGTIEMSAKLKGGETIPSRKLRFEGAIVSDLKAEPAIVQVGGRRLGEVFEEDIVLESLTGKVIGAIQTEFKGTGLSIEPLAYNRYRIRQKASSVGVQINEVKLSAELAGRHVTLNVPVSYIGIEPR